MLKAFKRRDGMKKSRLVLSLALVALLCAASVASAQSSGAHDGRIWRPQYGGFDVDVVVGGGTLEALYGRGRRYVEAREGAEYELVLRNPLPVRVAVALSVDGLNTIDARRTSAWDASKWVIEPYGTIRISGWQMSSSHARRFYFTNERDSYAAKIGRASDLGVITAVFYREQSARPYPVTPPPYEDEDMRRPRDRSEAPKEKNAPEQGESRSNSAGRGATTARPQRDDDYAATGIGRSVEHDVTWIQMRLERSPASEISIRYEYHNALVRLGILPRPWTDDNALRRRERARGFSDPNYCPEP
jgi:hypothetical protein